MELRTARVERSKFRNQAFAIDKREPLRPDKMEQYTAAPAYDSASFPQLKVRERQRKRRFGAAAQPLASTAKSGREIRSPVRKVEPRLRNRRTGSPRRPASQAAHTRRSDAEQRTGKDRGC